VNQPLLPEMLLADARRVVISDPSCCEHCGGTEIHRIMTDDLGRSVPCIAGDRRVFAAGVMTLAEALYVTRAQLADERRKTKALRGALEALIEWWHDEDRHVLNRAAAVLAEFQSSEE
jgi:hypothetical protein